MQNGRQTRDLQRACDEREVMHHLPHEKTAIIKSTTGYNITSTTTSSTRDFYSSIVLENI